MNKSLLAVLLPPVAIGLYGGRAAWCAAPIGTAWMSALVGIAVGLQGDLASATYRPSWWVVGLGVFIWVVSSVWAETVINAVDHDIGPKSGPAGGEGEPEDDPLEQVRSLR